MSPSLKKIQEEWWEIRENKITFLTAPFLFLLIKISEPEISI